MVRLFLLIILSFLCFSIQAEPKLIRYSYLGNFKALVNVPAIPGKLPVIVYGYDEFYDWAGKAFSYSSGYNLHQISDAFSRWGYISIIPIERYRKVNAILGAFQYLQNHPKVDTSNIHFIGLSEGAFMGLIAYQKQRKFKTLTLLAPISIDDKGYLSLHRFQYHFKKETIPVLFLEAKDVAWRINSQRDILYSMKQYFSNITYYSYDLKKHFFWNPSFSYMDTIQKFLAKQYN